MEKKLKYVVFDFDGTLTTGNSNVWVNIWQNLNLPEGFKKLEWTLFDMYKSGKITYEKWVEYTNSIFISGGMNIHILDYVCYGVNPVAGLKPTLQKLKDDGYGLYIVSGGIKQAIEMILGDSAKLFDGIYANEMWFDQTGRLIYTKPTNYDYYGKAKFVANLIRERHIKPQNVIFVGNGLNDEYVHTTGCRTICVNPEKGTHFRDKKIWNHYIPNLKNLSQIQNFIEVNEYQR